MAKKTKLTEDSLAARYEYRVWGEHKKAQKLLSKLATDETTEEIEDCYLIVEDQDWNAKIRNGTLKVKQLVDEERGFERWVSNRHQVADTAPAPFDDLFVEMGLDRPARGKSFSLSKAVAGLDTDAAARAIVVNKRRTRYRIGSIRAEVTDVMVESTDEVLQTIAIEGDDLDELVALRKKLGLKGSDNVPYHLAIDEES